MAKHEQAFRVHGLYGFEDWDNSDCGSLPGGQPLKGRIQAHPCHIELEVDGSTLGRGSETRTVGHEQDH